MVRPLEAKQAAEPNVGTTGDPDAEARAKWLDEGVKSEELDLLASMAPLRSWDLQWERYGRDTEDGQFLTMLRCPNCGSEIRHQLTAVDDFYCDDCEFDVHDDESGRQPTPCSF